MANTPVVMPKMSMTMTEGEVVEILVSVGDEVTAGQVIAVVGTDKTDMEVESDHAGKVLEVPAKHGDVLEVGSPLIVLETKSEDLLAGLFGSDKPEGETEQAETPAANASPEIKPGFTQLFNRSKIAKPTFTSKPERMASKIR